MHDKAVTLKVRVSYNKRVHQKLLNHAPFFPRMLAIKILLVSSAIHSLCHTVGLIAKNR